MTERARERVRRGRATTARPRRRPEACRRSSGMTARASAVASADRTWLPCPPGPPARRTCTRPWSSRLGLPAIVALRGHPDEAASAAALGDVLGQDRPVDRPEEVVVAVAGEPAQRGPDEQLEGHERRDRVARQPEEQRRRSIRVGAVVALAPARSRTRTACRAGRRPATDRSCRTPRTPARTTSYGPTETPPDTMIASAPSTSPAHRRARTSSKRSAAIPRCRGWPPAASTIAISAGPLASGMPAGPSSAAAARGPRRRSRGCRRAAGGGRTGSSRPTPAASPIDGGRQDRARIEDRGAGARSLPWPSDRATDRHGRVGRDPRRQRTRRVPAAFARRGAGRIERGRRLDRDDRVGARRARARRSRSGPRCRAGPSSRAA